MNPFKALMAGSTNDLRDGMTLDLAEGLLAVAGPRPGSAANCIKGRLRG